MSCGCNKTPCCCPPPKCGVPFQIPGPPGPPGPQGIQGNPGADCEEGCCIIPGTGLEACMQENTVNPNIASGDHSLALGIATVAQGEASNSTGNTTLASGDNSYAGGLDSIAFRKSEFARSDGSFNIPGDAQWTITTWKTLTEDDSPTPLLDSDGNAFLINQNSSLSFKVDLVGVATTPGPTTLNGDTFVAHIEGAAKSVGGNTTLVGNPSINIYSDANNLADGWGVSMLADDVNDTLLIMVNSGLTGSASWVAKLAITETIYPAT